MEEELIEPRNIYIVNMALPREKAEYIPMISYDPMLVNALLMDLENYPGEIFEIDGNMAFTEDGCITSFYEDDILFDEDDDPENFIIDLTDIEWE